MEKAQCRNGKHHFDESDFSTHRINQFELLYLVLRATQAEVAQLGNALVREQHIGHREVAVHDRRRQRVVQEAAGARDALGHAHAGGRVEQRRGHGAQQTRD